MWIPVLLYHRITNEISKASRAVCISPRAFDRQMGYLRQNGFKVVSLGQVRDAVEGERSLPARSVAITFDDGYRDNYYNAFPILQKYGFGATVFLVTDLIGRTNVWDQRSLGTRPVPLLSGPEIREMSKHGIEFGSHSRTHPMLTSLSLDEIAAEVAGSKRDLEDILGAEARFFSYPYFAAGEREHSVVESAGFAGACGGEDLRDSSCYHLNRVVILPEHWLITRMKFIGLYRKLRLNPLLRVLKHRMTPAHRMVGGARTNVTRC